MTDTVAGPDPDPKAGSPSAPPAPPGGSTDPAGLSDTTSRDIAALPETPSGGAPGDWRSSAGFEDTQRGEPWARLTYEPGPGTDPQPPADAGLRPPDAGFQLEAPLDTPGRHPLDPDPAPSTKAAAVLALGVAALITGPLVGGVVPATLALLLARQARAELLASRGYLTGARQVRHGVTLAWVGIGLAVAAMVVAVVFGILSLADVALRDFPDTSN